MALKKCKECGHEVSTKAKKCPNCGVKNPTQNKVLNFFVGLGVIIFFIIILSSGGGNDVDPQADGFSTLSLNVRRGPSTDHEVITALKKGEQVRYISDSLGWKQIRLIERDGNPLGWASGTYLKDISEFDSWNEKQEEIAEQNRREKQKNAWRNENDYIGAYTAVQMEVENRLKAPSTASFPWDKKPHVQREGNTQIYEVNSYVDAENSFGANIRTYFTAKVHQVEDDHWDVYKLEIHE